MHLLGAFIAGFLVATVTTPAGVSGAVLLVADPGQPARRAQPRGDADQPDLQPVCHPQRRASLPPPGRGPIALPAGQLDC